MAVGNAFGNLFGKSPIGPIQDHMLLADEAARELVPLFDAAVVGDWETANEVRKRIGKLERDADKIKGSVRTHLPKSMFMPVSRSDLLRLIATQDQIANRAQDIARILVERQMTFPEKLNKGLTEYVSLCVDASSHALRVIQELDELLEVGFSGREVTRVNSMIKEVGKIERRTDKLGNGLHTRLFKLEAELPPVDVMFMYRILGLLGELADHAEQVGQSLQILIAR